MTDIACTVDIWLRGDHSATTRDIGGVVREPGAWVDDDVRAVLEGMLLEMHRLKHPDDSQPYVALRGISWIVNAYEGGGVVIAIEITLGAAIAGPFNVDKQALEQMITRVLAEARGDAGAATIH